MIKVDETVRCYEPIGRHANISRVTFSTSLLEDRLVAWQDRNYKPDAVIPQVVIQAVEPVFVGTLVRTQHINFARIIEYRRSIEQMIGDVITVLYQVEPETEQVPIVPGTNIPAGLKKEVEKQKLGVKPPPPKPPKEILKIPKPQPRNEREDLWGDGDDDE